MSFTKLLGVVILTLGVLALVYKGFDYTKKTRTAKVGALQFSVKDKERVEVPTWAGVAAVVVGGGLLAASRRR